MWPHWPIWTSVRKNCGRSNRFSRPEPLFIRRKGSSAMHRVYNFSAGPSVLPLPVLQKAASEITDYQGCGMSVMEMSHRSPVFEAIIADTERRLRDIMAIPDNYRVLFLQGGATAQF